MRRALGAAINKYRRFFGFGDLNRYEKTSPKEGKFDHGHATRKNLIKYD